MPETKKAALARAKKQGFPASSVTKSKDNGYFIAPHGVDTKAGKDTYADCRAKGGSKEKCAKIAHTINKKK